jgi:hypothetical protein
MLHAICHWFGHTRLGHWLELDHSPSLQWLGRCQCKSCSRARGSGGDLREQLAAAFASRDDDLVADIVAALKDRGGQ